MHEVSISSMSPDRYREVCTPGQFAAAERGIGEGRELLVGRVVWNVNSTARGGGVAGLLSSLVAYARGAGVDVRWLAIDGSPECFAVTKSIHNRLHGAPGDGGPLAEAAGRIYETTLVQQPARLSAVIRTVLGHRHEGAVA
jgi:trehalose synthase